MGGGLVDREGSRCFNGLHPTARDSYLLHYVYVIKFYAAIWRTVLTYYGSFVGLPGDDGLPFPAQAGEPGFVGLPGLPGKPGADGLPGKLTRDFLFS